MCPIIGAANEYAIIKIIVVYAIIGKILGNCVII